GQPTTVTFAAAGGGRVSALVSALSATQATVVVPNGAVTGTIELTTQGGTAASSTTFTVDVQGYELTVAPSAASAVQRTSAVYVVSVTSSTGSFTQLATLSVSGLPAGVSASFDPVQITAGASSTLSVSLANVDLAAGSYPFTINSSALADGSPLLRTASA